MRRLVSFLLILLTAAGLAGAQVVNRLNVDDATFQRYAWGHMQEYDAENLVLADSLYQAGVAAGNYKYKCLGLSSNIPCASHRETMRGWMKPWPKSRNGTWQRQGYYRNIVVFDGDAKVGVGSKNEKFVGFDTLEDRMMNSHRYYSIPDEILVGKYMLYGLLPNNEFIYGRQYTFHIGLDLSSVYHTITFAPSVSDRETKIYENNDTF